MKQSFRIVAVVVTVAAWSTAICPAVLLVAFGSLSKG